MVISQETLLWPAGLVLMADHKRYLDLSLVPQERSYDFYKVLAFLQNQKERVVEA